MMRVDAPRTRNGEAGKIAHSLQEDRITKRDDSVRLPEEASKPVLSSCRRDGHPHLHRGGSAVRPGIVRDQPQGRPG